MIDYSKVYNSRTGAVYDLTKLTLQAKAELDRDAEYVVTLKHRPFEIDAKTANLGDLSTFSSEPYLEREDFCVLGSVNGLTCKQACQQADITLIYVHGQGCYGCKAIEPLLTSFE
jgi:hypothetical protein